MSKSYKPVPMKGTIGEAVSEAFSEIQSLAEEMREWADNMENNGLGHTPKCEEVSECADALEQFDEEDIPTGFADIDCEWVDLVPRRKRQAPSRASRRDCAAARLRGAAEALRDHAEAIRADIADDDAEADEDEAREADELADRMEEIADEAEAIDFPGMF